MIYTFLLAKTKLSHVALHALTIYVSLLGKLEKKQEFICGSGGNNLYNDTLLYLLFLKTSRKEEGWIFVSFAAEIIMISLFGNFGEV